MDLGCDPAILLREGRQLKNSSQNIPQASLELKENSEEWLKLRHVLAPIFDWISELVRHCLMLFHGIFTDVLS